MRERITVLLADGESTLTLHGDARIVAQWSGGRGRETWPRERGAFMIDRESFRENFFDMVERWGRTDNAEA